MKSPGKKSPSKTVEEELLRLRSVLARIEEARFHPSTSCERVGELCAEALQIHAALKRLTSCGCGTCKSCVASQARVEARFVD
jgi:hypothetical protein